MSRVLDELYRAARVLWDARPDLRAEHGSIESLSYWSWLLSTGMAQDARLAALLPMPPPELTMRVVGTREPRIFHESGLSDASNLHASLRLGGFDPARGGRLLDFGCGCGRILRAFARMADSIELHGADVDRAAIEWDREHYDFARFECIPDRPPTTYPDGYFAAVESFSVFSHLPEDRHFEWLRELRRITRPGAVLALTTMGQRCFDRYQNGDYAREPLPPHEQMERDRPRFAEQGYLYYPLHNRRPWVSGVDERVAEYGMTFITEAYVRRRWSELFELVAFRPAQSNWQDHVVLRRT